MPSKSGKTARNEGLKHVSLFEAKAVEINLGRNHSLQTMFSLIGYGLYGLGIVDFAGMIFGYDLTGVSWSPIAFWAAGYGLQALQMAIDGKN